MTRTQAAGFSLVELLIVVALVAVLAAMAAPQVTAGMKRYSLISASQQVASTIRSARAQAVAKNRTLRVRFDCPADDQYRIVEVTGNAGIDDAGNRCDVAAYPFPAADLDPLTLPNLDGAVQPLPDGIEFGDVTDFDFTPAGRMPDGMAAATIIVSNGDADQDRTITVSASGQVRLP